MIFHLREFDLKIIYQTSNRDIIYDKFILPLTSILGTLLIFSNVLYLLYFSEEKKTIFILLTIVFTATSLFVWHFFGKVLLLYKSVTVYETGIEIRGSVVEWKSVKKAKLLNANIIILWLDHSKSGKKIAISSHRSLREIFGTLYPECSLLDYIQNKMNEHDTTSRQ